MDGQPKVEGAVDGHRGALADGGGFFRAADLVLRVSGVAATLVAAVVMGVAEEETTVPVQISATLPPIPLAVTAKSGYSKAFVYFVVVNSIACAYAAISLGVSAATSAARKGTPARLLFAGDLLMVILLLSGNGAAAAIGDVGRNGNSHVRWKKICNVFGRFCAFVTASVGVSLLGSLAFTLLLLVAFLSAHRKSH